MFSFPDASAQLFGFSLLALGSAAVLSLAFERNGRAARTLGALLCFAGSAAAAIASILAIFGVAPAISLGTFPVIGKIYFGLDGLSGFFALIVSFVGAAVSVYSLKYMDEYEKKGYEAGTYWALLALFLLSMLAVVAAKNALLFLVSWELMALSSFFLVTYEGRNEGVKNAGFIYLLVAHLGAALLTVMFLILAGSAGSLDFADFAGVHLPQYAADAVFVLALLGFGSKAGVIPFHIWLPKAHPQAPSGISALMSGVMLKVAVYGFILVAFNFLGASAPPLWWGELAIVIGAVSALLGVLYALLQHDLKRMLAYHSIENIGIIFIGIGAALMFSSSGNPAFAALALFAALYHSLNHALFKSLLFMGAGSVIQATHETELDRLGGLAKLMPLTGAMFFLASYAISAVPPLNGFVSEWLTFQALIAGAGSVGSSQFIFGIAAVSLALTSALALAAFVKVFGIVFLGAPRSEKTAHAKEVPALMLWGMAAVAVACLLTGIFPGVVSELAAPALTASGFGAVIGSGSAYSSAGVSAAPMLQLFVALVLVSAAVALLGIFLKKAFDAKNHTRPTWACGIYEVTPRMEYTAGGFSMPLLRVFDRLAHPVQIKAHGADFFEEAVYQPIYRAYDAVSSRSGFLQTGQVSYYLFYILIALLGVLLFAVMK
jgi:hydrogenase-4 component B